MELAEDSFYFKELITTDCCCGGSKEPGDIFCKGCRKELGQVVYNDLNENIISNGFKELYEGAVKHLQDYTDRLI